MFNHDVVELAFEVLRPHRLKVARDRAAGGHLGPSRHAGRALRRPTGRFDLRGAAAAICNDSDLVRNYSRAKITVEGCSPPLLTLADIYRHVLL